MSLLRLHGMGSYRVPWVYGEEAAVTMAKFLDTKHRLMPYLFCLAIKAHTTGRPVQRAMFLEFPNDQNTYHLDRQYMLGPSLLVAPIFGPASEAHEYYIPAGIWTNFFHPERTVQGPRWMKEIVPIDDLPVWVRPGTVLCLGPTAVGRADYAFNKGLDVRLYAWEEGQEIETDVPSGKGHEISGSVKGKLSKGEVILDFQGVEFATISLIGFRSECVKIIGGAKTRKEANMLVCTPDKVSPRVVLKLQTDSWSLYQGLSLLTLLLAYLAFKLL